MRRIFTGALVALILALGCEPALAQDSAGKYGTRWCCIPFSVTTAWTGFAISGLKDQTTGAACSGTSWSDVWVQNTHGTQSAYLCLNAAADCPAAVTNYPPITAGASIGVGTLGVVLATGSPFTSVSVRGSAAATTGWLCGLVR